MAELAGLFLFGQAVKEIFHGTISLAKYINEVEQTRLIEEEQARKRQEQEERRKWREEYTCPQFLDQRNINIAVCGETGAGKSTFINTILGKKPGQPGAAKVGVNECTLVPVPYEAPQNGNLENKFLIWDLPGAGTVNFPLKGYIQKFGIRWYDTVVVVGETRLREIDVNLIKECERTKVQHLYVRTKMDHTVEDNEEQGKNASETFDEVRQSLQKNGIKNPYLIGRNYVRKLNVDAWENTDFRKLVQDLFQMTEDSAVLNQKLKKAM